MAATPRTSDLCPHSVLVQGFCDRPWNLIVKTRPTAGGFKFIFGIIERRITLTTHIDSGFLGIHILSRKRRFRAFVENDSFFFRG